MTSAIGGQLTKAGRGSAPLGPGEGKAARRDEFDLHVGLAVQKLRHFADVRGDLVEGFALRVDAVVLQSVCGEPALFSLLNDDVVGLHVNERFVGEIRLPLASSLGRSLTVAAQKTNFLTTDP